MRPCVLVSPAAAGMRGILYRHREKETQVGANKSLVSASASGTQKVVAEHSVVYLAKKKNKNKKKFKKKGVEIREEESVRQIYLYTRGERERERGDGFCRKALPLLARPLMLSLAVWSSQKENTQAQR